MTASQNGNNPRPKDGRAWRQIALVHHILELIRRLNPRAWLIENPMGMMRRVAALEQHERRTTTYCRYGATYQKTTDLWGGFPGPLHLEPTCKTGDSCHARGRRGKREGIPASANRTHNILVESDMRNGHADSWEAFKELIKATDPSPLIEDRAKAFYLHDDTTRRDARSALRALVPQRLSQDVANALEQMDPGSTWKDSTLHAFAEVTP